MVGTPGKLEIIGHDLVKDESGTRVLVTAKNIGSNVIELAEITVRFYDKNKTLIETSKDAIMNLNLGEIWTFTVTCSGTRCDQVDNYDVEGVAGTSSGIR